MKDEVPVDIGIWQNDKQQKASEKCNWKPHKASEILLYIHQNSGD